jgi:hypothetical protein
MKSLPRVRSQLFAVSLVAALMVKCGAAQPAPQLLASTDAPIVVRSVRVVPGPTGPALEILSNLPLVPAISQLDNPPRLVVDLPNADLPNALFSGTKNRIDFSDAEVRRVRVNQFQNSPPIARIVIDLIKPVGHTWDAAGNRLMIRLHAGADLTSKPPSVPAFTRGTEPVAVPLSANSTGTLILVGNHTAPGSSVTAGAETSVLRLERGGEVLVCPRTTVSVTASQNGHALMLGMSTGALEAHYNLDASADSIMTPDFRILMAGPGVFHYAVSADSRGNTCVRALPGNTASVIVSELLGDGNYQVKPTEQVVFRSGRLNLVDASVPASCGCPPPAAPLLRASEVSPAVVSDVELPRSARLPEPGEQLKPVALGVSKPEAGIPMASAVKITELPPETAALPPTKPSDVHVQVEAPFVFRAEDLPAPKPAPKPAPIREVELSQTPDLPRSATFQTEVLPPPQTAAKPERHGVFAKIKGIFASIFG